MKRLMRRFFKSMQIEFEIRASNNIIVFVKYQTTSIISSHGLFQVSFDLGCLSSQRYQTCHTLFLLRLYREPALSLIVKAR